MNWPQAFCFVGVVGVIAACVAYMWRVFCEMLKLEPMSEVRSTITGFKRPDDCPPPREKKFRLNPPEPWPGPPTAETECPHRREFTKPEWLLIRKNLCANGYPNFGNWLWMEMNASIGDSANCFFSDEEVQRVDAAAKRAGIVQEEEDATKPL